MTKDQQTFVDGYEEGFLEGLVFITGVIREPGAVDTLDGAIIQSEGSIRAHEALVKRDIRISKVAELKIELDRLAERNRYG